MREVKSSTFLLLFKRKMYVALQYDICFDPPRLWVSICGCACFMEVSVTPLWITLFARVAPKRCIGNRWQAVVFWGVKKGMLLWNSLQFKSCLVMGATNLQAQCPCHATRCICQLKARPDDALHRSRNNSAWLVFTSPRLVFGINRGCWR
jgi:hypothetical protein